MGKLDRQAWSARPRALNKTTIYLTSLPGSQDCPHQETLSLLGPSHLRVRSYKHINHLLIFSISVSTKRSTRDGLMCPVDCIIDQSVAAVHLCLDSSPHVETTKRADAIEIRCAGFAAVRGTCMYMLLAAVRDRCVGFVSTEGLPKTNSLCPTC